MFRSRLRQFPSLVTCCTIDWFSEWPDEALKSVALSSLNELVEIDNTDAIDGLVSILISCGNGYCVIYINDSVMFVDKNIDKDQLVLLY